MNILFLALDVDLDSPTGDAVHVRELAVAFAQLGYRTNLLVGGGSPHHFPDGVRTRVMIKRFGWRFRLLDDALTVLIGLSIMLTQGRGVIYERRFSCKIGAALKRITGSKLLVEINGIVDDELASQKKTGKKTWARSLTRADTIIAVAPKLAEVLVDRYGLRRERIKVVSNGVNSRIFYPRDKVACRRAAGIKADDFVFLFVGNLVEWYDFDTLLRAFAVYCQELATGTLIIIGDGSRKGFIIELAQRLKVNDRVIMYGPVGHTRVPDLIGVADVCVAPFTIARNGKIDLSPIKLFEYLASGRPVISNTIGGLERYQRDISSLHLVPPENVLALAQTMLRLTRANGQSDTNNDAELVRERFSWLKTASQIAIEFVGPDDTR